MIFTEYDEALDCRFTVLHCEKCPAMLRRVLFWRVIHDAMCAGWDVERHICPECLAKERATP
jgi:hypothetical protein